MSPDDSLAAPPITVGYRSLVTWIASENVRLDVAVWYPAKRAPSRLELGGQNIYAARGAAPLAGSWPVIILSHDSSGTRFAHHHLAAMLTKRGYIVLAPQHEGDNADDMRLLFTSTALEKRARHLSVALDMLLADEALSAVADVRNIGIMGFGNGGMAALLTAGAKITDSRWADYCAGESADNPYCQGENKAHLEAVIQSMRDAKILQEQSGVIREQALDAREKLQKRFDGAIAKNRDWLIKAQKKNALNFPDVPFVLPYFPPLAPDSRLEDMRFSHIILVSPGISMLFDAESLQSLHAKILLIGLDHDALNLPEYQALPLQKGIGPEEALYRLLENADIPGTQAPCPPALDLPDLCGSVSEEQRQIIAEELYTNVLSFLPPPFLDEQ